ncbi:hypothetical protein F5146DRAFT_145457 [Armillaria mellea]|nr:hypothetical protein F5146DRAFT_145457 [Armillaria mellea]
MALCLVPLLWDCRCQEAKAAPNSSAADVLLSNRVHPDMNETCTGNIRCIHNSDTTGPQTPANLVQFVAYCKIFSRVSIFCGWKGRERPLKNNVGTAELRHKP